MFTATSTIAMDNVLVQVGNLNLELCFEERSEMSLLAIDLYLNYYGSAIDRLQSAIDRLQVEMMYNSLVVVAPTAIYIYTFSLFSFFFLFLFYVSPLLSKQL